MDRLSGTYFKINLNIYHPSNLNVVSRDPQRTIPSPEWEGMEWPPRAPGAAGREGAQLQTELTFYAPSDCGNHSDYVLLLNYEWC